MNEKKKNKDMGNLNEPVQKKVTLRRGVWYDIEAACEKCGYKDEKQALTDFARVGNMETMVEKRMRAKLSNDSARLKTILNKIEAKIDVEENMSKFVLEAERLCAELR